jgi:hypothetical protein
MEALATNRSSSESGTAAAYGADAMSSGFGAPDPRPVRMGQLRKAIAA